MLRLEIACYSAPSRLALDAHCSPKKTQFITFRGIIATVKQSPKGYLWSLYDSEADVLYVNFKKPSRATDSELTDDDIIIRYEGETIIDITMLHASKR